MGEPYKIKVKPEAKPVTICPKMNTDPTSQQELNRHNHLTLSLELTLLLPGSVQVWLQHQSVEEPSEYA